MLSALLVSNPVATLARRTKLLSRRPAPTRRIRARATSETIRAFRARLRPAIPLRPAFVQRAVEVGA